MNKVSPPVTPQRFYGNSLQGVFDEREKRIQDRKKCPVPKKAQRMPETLLGPTTFWREFYKQEQALHAVTEYSTETDLLSAFVYEMKDGHRRFVTAHPEVYWWYNEHKENQELRCSYEIIQENTPCWMYFDLEFQKDKNPDSNGVQMTHTLIAIMCGYFSKHYAYPCSSRNVVILDSSDDTKFSRHLTFCLKDIAFKNNYHVGRLVKTVCSDIMNFLSHENMKHDVLSNIPRALIAELIINTDKGSKLFIDTAVYSKNRHFRIYKATKFGKKRFLLHASDCEHVQAKDNKDADLGIFLNSLISYFPNKKNLILLEFDENKVSRAQLYTSYSKETFQSQEHIESPYPTLDNYVVEVVKPGKIRTSKYIENKHLVIYEIVGNRYCENIGRHHKSNNIYWVVDVMNKIMYQKCHDEDCAGFASTPKALPERVYFYFDDEADDILSSALIPDDLEWNESVEWNTPR